MTDGFASRLAGVFAGQGRLCVGIDPHAWLLSEWGLPDSADGAREFGLRVVDAVAGLAGIVKPQVAWKFVHGVESMPAAIRSAGVLRLPKRTPAKRTCAMFNRSCNV